MRPPTPVELFNPVQVFLPQHIPRVSVLRPAHVPTALITIANVSWFWACWCWIVLGNACSIAFNASADAALALGVALECCDQLWEVNLAAVLVERLAALPRVTPSCPWAMAAVVAERSTGTGFPYALLHMLRLVRVPVLGKMAPHVHEGRREHPQRHLREHHVRDALGHELPEGEETNILIQRPSEVAPQSLLTVECRPDVLHERAPGGLRVHVKPHQLGVHIP